MKSKQIARLFCSLADLAAGKGMAFSLELRDSESLSEVLNGALANSSYRDGGLILRAWLPEIPDVLKSSAAEMVGEEGMEAGNDK